MTAVAGDVPNKFDVVINGEGYLHADAQDIKGEYGYTPTFVTRQNTQGDYGDNQQDFWMTYTQRDWSLGEQQRYQGRDDDSKRRYWQAVNADVTSTVGQVALAPVTTTGTIAQAVLECCDDIYGDHVFMVSATNMYRYNNDGTVTGYGTHGLGDTPTCVVVGGQLGTPIFISCTNPSTVGIRKCTGVSTFSTWSATPVDAMAFLNNTLYGCRNNTSQFYSFDTAGTATSIFQWKDADGTVPAASRFSMIPFGGKVMILRYGDTGAMSSGAELYIHDGTAPAIVARLQAGFLPKQIREVAGTAFISGAFVKIKGGASQYRPAIFYYSGGTIGLLWQADGYKASIKPPAMCPFNNGLTWSDDYSGRFLFYNPATGGVSGIGAYTVTNAEARMAGATSFVAHTRSSTDVYRFPGDGASSSATIQSSLIDFDSSLNKLFRGIRVEFDSATDGDGGSVDISYRTGDVDGSYTSLQTGATSGTEYTLSGVTGRSISVKVTLNKGTSTTGPMLKRISVRAAPQQPGFKKFTLVLQLAGTKALDGQMMQLRDGRPHTKSGEEMADNLFTAAASTTPFAVTTELHGTISACEIDQEGFKIQRIRKNEYVAYVPIREV